jgi:hypothetical protein
MDTTGNQEQAETIEGDFEFETGESKTWRAVKICWTVIMALIYIVLAFLVLARMEGAFQTVVCCLLLLIFQSVVNTHTTSIRMLTEEAFVHRTLFGGILKRLGDPDCDEGFKQLRGLAAKYDRTTVHWYINSTAYYIVFLIVLWKIISVVVL